MVYAYDQWAQMPVKDLYDTQIMAMAINAAKDMYDKGEQAIKDFKKEYGDFYTPLAKDAEWYAKEFGIRNVLDDMYSRGIDPLRSAEGRAEIAKWLNTRDYAGLNMRKLSGEIYNKYLENQGKLRADNEFDEDQERFFAGSKYDPNTWDTGVNGVWDRYSPQRAVSIKDLTEKYVDKRTPGLLTKEEVEKEFGLQYDPRAEYVGYSPSMLKRDIGKAVPAMLGDPQYKYFRHLAEKQLVAEGKKPTEEEINERFQQMASDANREYIATPTPDYKNWFGFKNLENQTRQTIAAERKAKAAEDANVLTRTLGWTGSRQYNTMTRMKNNGTEHLARQLSVDITKGILDKSQRPSDGYSSAYRMLYKSASEQLRGDHFTTGMALFTNLEDKQVVDGVAYNKKLPIVFGGNLHLTANKERDFALPYLVNASPGLNWRNITVDKELQAFENWLNSNEIRGSVWENDLSSKYDQIGAYSVYDLSGQVAVNKKDIEKFFGGDVDKFKRVADKAGLSVVLTTGKELSQYNYDNPEEISKTNPNKNDLKWENIEKVIIPATRTVDATDVDNVDINTFHDNLTMKAIGAKRENTHEGDKPFMP